MKKSMKESLKESLQNEDFKNKYNSLSDEEKEYIKEKYIKFCELRDCVKENHTGNIKEFERIARENLREEAYKKGFKKPEGKKAKLFFHNRVFVYKIDNYFIGVKAEEFFKKSALYSYFALLEMSTERGKLYVDFRGGNDSEEYYSGNTPESLLIYTAHFFDRYSERLNLKTKREETIHSFIKHELATIKVGSASITQDGNTYLNLSKGLGLCEDLTEDMLLIKTFISNNETNSYQERQKQELEDMSSE